MLSLTKEELLIANQLKHLKSKSGSHSPSIYTISEQISDIKINIDACFLSNPYATDLLLEYFNKDVLGENKFKELIERYPAQNQNIAQSIADQFNISADNIFVGNGATEIIQSIVHYFTKKKILINIPTFSPYYEFAKNNIEVLFNQLPADKNFQLDLDIYIETVKRKRPDTIVLINPNNPDGSYLDLHSIFYLLKRLSFVNTIVIDESFSHFVPDETQGILSNHTDIINKYKNVIIIQSLSKHFGISGIRAGFALMSQNRVKALLSSGYLWNISGLAQYFIRVISSQNFQKEYQPLLKKYIAETQSFFSALSQTANFKVYPSKANFCLLELTDGTRTNDFVAKLLKGFGIYVRDCRDKIGLKGEFIRISSKTESANNTMVKSILEIYNS